MEAETKYCNGCGNTKSAEEFYWRNSERRARASRCKSCRCEASRAQKRTHSTYRNASCSRCGKAITRQTPRKNMEQTGLCKACYLDWLGAKRVWRKMGLVIGKMLELASCEECGCEITGPRDYYGKANGKRTSKPSGRRLRYCSAKCNSRASRRTRRARLRGVMDEHVTVAYITSRDGWRCQICGRIVNPNTKQYKRQPTLDHITPLANGGRHCRENLQLAHFDCNSRKQATGGQKRLIG